MKGHLCCHQSHGLSSKNTLGADIWRHVPTLGGAWRSTQPAGTRARHRDRLGRGRGWAGVHALRLVTALWGLPCFVIHKEKLTPQTATL